MTSSFGARAHILGTHEADAEASRDGAQAEGDGEMRLTDARRPQPQGVRGLGYEGQRGEVTDVAFIDGGLEAEIELLERPLKRQVGQACARPQIALAPRRDVAPKQSKTSLLASMSIDCCSRLEGQGATPGAGLPTEAENSSERE